MFLRQPGLAECVHSSARYQRLPPGVPRPRRDRRLRRTPDAGAVGGAGRLDPIEVNGAAWFFRPDQGQHGLECLDVRPAVTGLLVLPVGSESRVGESAADEEHA